MESILNNHLIYNNIYKNLHIDDLIKLYNIEEFKKSTVDHILTSKEIDWKFISINQKLSEDFIREFKDKVNWSCISSNQKLSESFIKEFKDEVYWDHIPMFHQLSECFIREFKDKVNWEHVSAYQKLSEQFIRLNIKLFFRLKNNNLEKNT